MLAGYEEPSLVFALGADVALTDGAGAAEQGADQGGLALVDDDERPRFLARLAELAGRRRARWTICPASTIRAARRSMSRSIASRQLHPVTPPVAR